MYPRTHNWRSVLATCLVATAAVFCCQTGERVVFSDPDTPLVAPKADRPAKIPEPSRELRGFGFSAPAPEMPYVPPPPPRSDSKKAEKKTIFDEPAIFSDRQADAQKEQENSLGLKSPYGRSTLGSPYQSFSSPWADPGRSGESERALSPVRRYDWNPAPGASAGEKSNDRAVRWQDGPGGGRSGLFAPRGEEMENEPRGFLGWLRPAPKRELTAEQLERKAEFERILNPSYAPLARTPVAPTPNSSPLDAVKMPSPMLSPVPAPAIPPRRSLDPMEGYHERMRALRGPTMEDLNRRVFGAASVTPPSTPQPSLIQRKPLKHQPTIQDFPTRQF